LKPRLLIIEDDPRYRELLAQMLGAEFDLEMAATLTWGLELQANTRFDCTLLDIGLPDSVPAKTFSIFKDHFPDAPVIIVTCNDDPSAIAAHLRLSACGYIIKGRSDNPETLGAAIRSAINDHRSCHKLEAATEILSSAPLPEKR